MTRTGKVPGSGSSEAEVRRSSSYEEGPPTRRGSDDGSIISEKVMRKAKTQVRVEGG